jgi:predicted nucleic acid-binding protein
MNIAIDTNIIVYSLSGVERTAAAAAGALEDAANKGGALVVSAPVYAELLAMPGSSRTVLDAFFAEARVRVDWEIDEASWISAGDAFAAYARRRKRQRIALPRRILADFVIGAHSLSVGALLTADAAFFRTSFPDLRVLSLSL